MGLGQPAETRWFPRYHNVVEEFSGYLARGDAVLPGRILDVSREGLGVLMEQPLKAGEVIDLHCEGRRIPVAVVYCDQDLIHKGRFRAGLRQPPGSRENLVALFGAAGWLVAE